MSSGWWWRALPVKPECVNKICVDRPAAFAYNKDIGCEACQNRLNRGCEACQNRLNRGYEAYQNRLNGYTFGVAITYMECPLSGY